MGDNLPPGVTAQDIDDHFGGDPDEAYVTLNIVVDVPASGYNEEQMVADARDTFNDALAQRRVELINIESGHIEPR